MSNAAWYHNNLHITQCCVHPYPAHSRLCRETLEKFTGVVLAPRLVRWSSKNPVSTIAAGYNFSVCTTHEGEVWSWGDGGSGQLGFGRVRRVPVPHRVTFTAAAGSAGRKPSFVAVACGWAHAMALSSKVTHTLNPC